MGCLTQLLAVAAFLAVGVVFSPDSFGLSSDDPKSPMAVTILKLAHLLCFATAWNAALRDVALWVTFISVTILCENIPTRKCGNLQSQMFRAHWMLAVCCAISVASFGYLHPWKSSSSTEKYQLGFLLSAFAFNLTNLFVFTPTIIEMMKQRQKAEKEEKIGTEIGGCRKKEAAKFATEMKFVMYHALSFLANILALSSLTMHSWYLASKINL